MNDNLKSHVLFIVNQLIGEDTSWHETCDDPDYPSAFDYLQDALDIEYIVNGKGEYLGARVLDVIRQFGCPRFTATLAVHGRAVLAGEITR